MTRRPRRHHAPAFKAKVALAELAQQFDVHANQARQWRSQLLEGATDVFGEARAEASAPAGDIQTLHAKIGQLTLENNFLAGALSKVGLLSAKRWRTPCRPMIWP